MKPNFPNFLQRRFSTFQFGPRIDIFDICYLLKRVILNEAIFGVLVLPYKMFS